MYPKTKNLSLEELSKILSALPELKSWINAVEEYALNRVKSGDIIPGYQLGLTRATRIFINEDKVLEMMETYSPLSLEQYYPRNLLSVAQMEKLMGKKNFNLFFENEVGYTVGNPKLIKAENNNE